MQQLYYELSIRLIMRLHPHDTQESDWYKTWHLSAHEAAQVQSLESNNWLHYSEVFVKVHSCPSRVYRVEVSLAEHAMYTARGRRGGEAG
ncbi:hypothetical protein P1X16_28450 [Hymenobacter sp. YC55]|nr:hypothetical protein [Hymenobacter sp. YC55]